MIAKEAQVQAARERILKRRKKAHSEKMKQVYNRDQVRENISGLPDKKTVDEWLREVRYTGEEGYVPSEFALEFVNFIKMVNGEEGEENKTPVVHYKMLDQIAGTKQNIANMTCRGSAKTSLMGEYLFLYLAVYGEIPKFGKVQLAVYISDSIENGVKNMRKNLQFRWENSDFLQKYVPVANFTDIRWEFKNAFGKTFIVKGYGAKTGVRGTKELGRRPDLAVLDDLISDDDARSPTVIDAVEDVVYKAVDYALHPTRRKTIWSGTPFNAKDPLYKAVESGAWWVNVFPICEQFPCKREEFRSMWPDRFTYEYVSTQYNKALLAGKIDTFNQELMLRIMSEEERLIKESDLRWYPHRKVLQNRGAFNFYMTTDFATSEKEAADFSVINVWGLNNAGDWFWVDGYCKKALMNESLDNLFLLAQKWQPQGVGIEVTGQQGAFIQWIQSMMMDRNIYFTLANQIGRTEPGIRPTKDKMSRFQTNAVPLFKAGKIYFPEELKEEEELREMLEELRLATAKGFKSKHDDAVDTISQLGEMYTWRPSEVTVEENSQTGERDFIWDEDDEAHESAGTSSYFV